MKQIELLGYLFNGSTLESVEFTTHQLFPKFVRLSRQDISGMVYAQPEKPEDEAELDTLQPQTIIMPEWKLRSRALHIPELYDIYFKADPEVPHAVPLAKESLATIIMVRRRFPASITQWSKFPEWSQSEEVRQQLLQYQFIERVEMTQLRQEKMRFENDWFFTLTPQGRDFVEGQLEIPEGAFMFEGHVLGWTTKMITVIDAVVEAGIELSSVRGVSREYKDIIRESLKSSS